MQSEYVTMTRQLLLNLLYGRQSNAFRAPPFLLHPADLPRESEAENLPHYSPINLSTVPRPSSTAFNIRRAASSGRIFSMSSRYSQTSGAP